MRILRLTTPLRGIGIKPIHIALAATNNKESCGYQEHDAEHENHYREAHTDTVCTLP